jgi:hypothetical protein
MDRRCGSSSRVPTLQAQTPEFKPYSHKTKQKKPEFKPQDAPSLQKNSKTQNLLIPDKLLSILKT